MFSLFHLIELDLIGPSFYFRVNELIQPFHDILVVLVASVIAVGESDIGVVLVGVVEVVGEFGLGGPL